MSGDLERRYRRVLRLLPGWYREQWEQDMVAAFLDSWLTGDPEADEYITGGCQAQLGGGRQRGRPGRPAVPGRPGHSAPVLRLGPGHAARGARRAAGARGAGR